MPYTPFHFGPGLLVKAADPRHVSFTAYAMANVAVDCEPFFNILLRHHPAHGHVHTLVVAAPLGLAAGAITALLLRRFFRRTVSSNPLLRAEAAFGAALWGGFLGGASHPLIDGMMHKDAHPFWPWTLRDPLLWLVPVWSIYVGCAVAGLLGWWILRARMRATAAG